MRALSRQRGMSAALVIVLMIVVLIAVLATYTLSRIRSSGSDTTEGVARLQRAAAALEAFAGSSQRLPCPADPTLDTGLEVLPAAGAATCSNPDGSLPWRTIGMKREDSLDPWGRKLAYRVYTGAAGSLTQPGGVSMVNCDTNESSPGGATMGGGGFGGLCKDGGGNPYLRDTTPAQFLAGKGLSLNDSGAAYNDVAYVIISTGVTGLGGYTASGAQLDLPAGDERNNLRATGPFTIKAFSDVDVAATFGTHFDDLVVYRRLSDLVGRVGLAARDWPESGGSLVFDAPTVSAALGSTVSPGGLGRTTLAFTGAGAQVSGVGSGGAAAELSFDTVSAWGGLGIAGGGSNLIQSSANESLRIDFGGNSRSFGVTLADFGYYGFIIDEFVQFNFYKDGAAVGTFYGFGCNVDGGLASFSMDVGADFNRVDIVPLPAIDFFFGTTGNITAFLVSEVKACPVGASTCRTSLDDAVTNRCS